MNRSIAILGGFLLIYGVTQTIVGISLGWTSPFTFWASGVLVGQGAMALAIELGRRMAR